MLKILRAHPSSASFLLAALLCLAPLAHAQGLLDVTARITTEQSSQAMHGHPGPRPAAAIWLTALHPEATSASPKGGSYTLLQKNKMFSPHLLIVPVDSIVRFPNADPFFHNVFSLFNGRRFDLGLYEAGTTRDVVFSREGVSYIFCNIHPEMSAVVLVVNTAYFGIVDAQERIHLKGVPPDTYILHVWVEGENQEALDKLTRKVQIAVGHTDLDVIHLPQPARPAAAHENKFGQPYNSSEAPTY